MPIIHLTTFIAAPVERVFDLSRSIDLHKKSMSHTGEQAVAGTTMGLIGQDETVTWKAKHLFKTRIMKVRISDMKKPYSFTDEMVEGSFKSMKHEHHFKQIENGTLAIDLFSFETPWGVLGKMVNILYLRNYMEQLLNQRNQTIREYAESDKWKFILQK
ncbi:SRPBCC family protein [Paraflavitalea pollutisoli]|uniref:SRPBCC family protein n=1 Tax=Paraflavitalea pollutisoli TaxID=3034143 RepID=UPI0023EDFAF5|nr:SRPBCC family protein [Paraflavitalea sp. H1-2-19X]